MRPLRIAWLLEQQIKGIAASKENNSNHREIRPPSQSDNFRRFRTHSQSCFVTATRYRL